MLPVWVEVDQELNFQYTKFLLEPMILPLGREVLLDPSHGSPDFPIVYLYFTFFLYLYK